MTVHRSDDDAVADQVARDNVRADRERSSHSRFSADLHLAGPTRDWIEGLHPDEIKVLEGLVSVLRNKGIDKFTRGIEIVESISTASKFGKFLIVAVVSVAGAVTAVGGAVLAMQSLGGQWFGGHR